MGEVLASLSDRRRRYVLYYLYRRKEIAPVELEVLARRVAGWERGVPPASVPDEDVEAVIDVLSREGLPTLATRGLVEYDPLSGLVGRPEYTAPAEALLALLSRLELPARFLNP